MTARTDPGADPSARHRLPYNVRPSRYELHLAPDLERHVFSGSVSIEASAGETLERIELHSQELDIGTAVVRTQGGDRVPATVGASDHEDRIVLVPAEPVPAGPLHIDIAFSGVLNDKLHGFYRSTFTDERGAARTLATTQFEATDARRAFPCFDEPDRKAVFSVSVDVPPGLRAVSNGPVVSEEELPDGATRVRFGDTIPMSTYLVALVVGPLEVTEPVDVNGVPVRVVHVPGREHLTAFALQAAEHALRFFSEWFALPYPGDKLDLVAIPDFAFGAMENLGCVTFREAVLLVDPERASRIELERIADVVAHEIAHMWFGDLVTMKWWNGIWLNEAFATLMELVCVDSFRPEWRRWVSFGCERDAAMATDGLHSTRPVEYPVGSPDEAQGMFDVLTYQKGAGVLRMLERYLGAEVFRDGIRRYLAAHRLSNTETSDLWDALEEASGEPVRDIMDSWILQGGFPLLLVERSGETVAVHQEPFAYSTAAASSAIGSDWRVPVLARIVGDGDGAPRGLLSGEPITFEARPSGSPVVVNAGGAGFYRVAYDDGELRQLAGAFDELDTLEQFNLLSDAWAAVVAGRSGLGDFLVVAEAARRGTDPDVWTPVIGALGFLDHVVDDATRPVLAAYTRALVGHAFGALGWERRPGDGERVATLRGSLLATLGTVGMDEEVRGRCAAMHGAYLAGGEPLDPDLAPAVVAVTAAGGGPAEFEAFLVRHRDAANPQEEVRYLYALAGFEDAELAARAFGVAVDEARTQNGPYLVHHLLTHRVNGPATWERLRGRWDEVLGRFPITMAPRMLEGVKLLCRDPALGAEVRTFLTAHPIPSGQRTVEQIVERLGVNMALAARLVDKAADELAAGIDRLSPH